jgi:cytochrome c5
MDFIKTPKQFVLVILLAFAAPVLVFFLLATLVTSAFHLDMESAAMTPEAVAKRLEPVGKVVVDTGGAGTAGAVKAARSGEEVFKSVCSACHATGALNAPKIGDKEAWAPHIKEGLDTLVKNAIKGINQMPPKGGNPELSDSEVARAVVYLANQSGASFKEPAAEKTEKIAETKPLQQSTTDAKPTAQDKVAEAKPAREAKAPDAPKPAQPPSATAEDKKSADGKSVYESACAACHATGLAGAPKAGDKSEWAARIGQGQEMLYASALKGKGAMPPKGGNASLSDTEVKAAVDYVVGLAK